MSKFTNWFADTMLLEADADGRVDITPFLTFKNWTSIRLRGFKVWFYAMPDDTKIRASFCKYPPREVIPLGATTFTLFSCFRRGFEWHVFL